MKKYIFSVLAISFILASCTAPTKTQPVIQTPTEKKQPQTKDASTVFTTEQVAQHSTKDDCWLILDNGIYDVTAFIPRHPGGDKILRGCGKDATQMFAKHPESAKAMKEQFKIGTLAQ